MEKDRNSISPKTRRKKVKVIKADFDRKRQKREEMEYERYYLRIRNLSRGI